VWDRDVADRQNQNIQFFQSKNYAHWLLRTKQKNKKRKENQKKFHRQGSQLSGHSHAGQTIQAILK
jgi:hypothetical protein